MNYYAVPGLKKRKRFGRRLRTGLKISPDKIIKIITKHFSISIESIQKKDRSQNIVYARRMICYFLYKYSLMSLTEIGKIFGGQDHTTILYHIKTLNDLRWAYPQIEAEILIIDNKL